ncbi:uncharacterized protein LOC131067373 isoform X2 [Cryptomeria japonica]|uniref:uncharacterized protein LOC131067373 isoform X2 n=1 Tax=Cryptomeria japonica TaxID=3369 RepID=UPI0025AC075B|nr:uncharacterized protein LOC131067373 isoform X2 [Cryptomeria japonica]
MWKFDEPPPPPSRKTVKKKPKKKRNYDHAKLRATKDGENSTMYVPSKSASDLSEQKQTEDIIDPELRYTFQRNFQFIRKVFSVDPYLKPLPAPIGQSIGRSLGFFTSIFTQFFGDPMKTARLGAVRGVASKKN